MGVHIRLAQRLAKRNQVQGWSCQGRWDHALAHRMEYDKRQPDRSFLWTMLREPTKRAVSQFFHFRVTRENVTPTDQVMLQDLATDTQYAHYYLRYLSTKQAKVNENTGIEIISSILQDYDFIGITERFDESIVALLMILNLTDDHMSDGLYLDSKTSGSYDDKCFYIQPSFVSSRMSKYFESPFWQRKVKWDTALYHAANRSLDMTIDALGRLAFQDRLSKFRQMQALGRERCASLEVFPCTSKGEVNKHVSCLWIDSGCGSDCLDSLGGEVEMSADRVH